MDLWIRSQDKMNLVQIKQISLNYQDNKQVIANYVPEQYENSGCYFELLGTYKTKERALKVLDEIQEHIGFLNVEMCAGRFGELDFQSDIIFQMPKE